MRLHELTMSAFGPFAGHEVIDFDELSEAGLFLLTGPTGAGKTSILDAISFALYGCVPGARGVKTLKSQHAPAEAHPEVVLDFSIAERRFVIRRSPEWSRPKRRGEGVTEQKACATLVEVTNGEEHFLSSRAQEVGHLISGLIGMNATQFAQVAMLPQGEFQNFLRASTQDRHDVLQHLFKTDRFSRIEEWVSDHTKTLNAQASSGQHAVRRLLDAMADRAGIDVPEGLAMESSLSTVSGAHVAAWARQLTDKELSALALMRARHRAARDEVLCARTRHEETTRCADLVARRDRALASLAALLTDSDTEEAARHELDDDARVATCGPVLKLLDAATAAQALAATDRHRALTTVRRISNNGPQADVEAAELNPLERETHEFVTRVEALLPRERELARAREQLDDTEAEITNVHGQLASAQARGEQVPDEIVRVRAVRDATAEIARRADAIATALATARAQTEAARDVPQCAHALETAMDNARNARDAAADAREKMQQLMARRLAGIAGELAAHLERGVACQVCGSLEHPRPAGQSPDAVSQEMQQEAAARYQELDGVHEQARSGVALATRKLDSLRQASAGLELDTALGQESNLLEELARAETAEKEHQTAQHKLDELAAEATALGAIIHARETSLIELEHIAHSQRDQMTTGSAEIAQVLAVGGGSLREVLETAHEALDTIAQATSAVQAYEQAHLLAEQYAAHAEELVTQQGFDSVQQAHLASLPTQERDRLEQLVRDRDEARARATGVLQETDLADLGTCLAPDASVARHAVEAAEIAEAEAARLLHRHEQAAAALTSYFARLEPALEEWIPARDEYLRAESMSKLVRGVGGDNHLQMRLSAYVLATRLDQVVAAANERLSRMRDQRYLLERTGKALRKNAQAGLGLQVVDEWTGSVREPTTLSGGETFVVSLSLALGLADVVTQEAGGVDIETLFVDEGFGMLDADTLDDVMDRLDDLRAGGRAVGVVSHVSEMRDRIATQVHVDKGRSGSTVSIRTLVG